MQYLTTGEPVTNAWLFVNGYMQKSNKFFPKGTIVTGQKVSLNIGGHQRDFIKIGVAHYLRPQDVIVSKPNTYAKADGNTGASTTAEVVVVPPIMKALPSIIGSVGFIWGLGYSFKKDKGFWAYVGYSFLGSIAGSAVGGLITVIAYPSTLDALRKKSFSGAEGKTVVKKPSPKKQKWGCMERGGVECCRPRKWKFNSETNDYVCY